MRFLLSFFGALALLASTAPAAPARPSLQGSLALQAPVERGRSGAASSPSTQLLAHLEIQDLVPRSPLTVVLNVRDALDGGRFRGDVDSGVQVGLEFPVRQDVRLYSYWERKSAPDRERIWAGVRWSFRCR